MSVLSIDFETRATAELRKCGVYAYAEHPETDIWCMAWAFDDEEPVIWTPGWRDREELDGPLDRVFQHIRAGGEVRAWNAQFERLIWREIMVKRYGAPPVMPKQWHCTMAEAAAMALPLSLEQCAVVLGLTEQKDMDGSDLMRRMAKPRKIHEGGRIEWWDVPERIERLHKYCKQDVRVERAAAKAIRRLTPKEREIYLLDQRTNDRGVRIDLELVDAAQAIADEGTARANADMSALTDGGVKKVVDHRALRFWLNGRGVETESVGKPAVTELLEGELEPGVRVALELRSEAGRTSLAKLKSMREAACRDGRARGLLQYHAAGTGRWGGRLIQPQNFPRGEVSDVESWIPTVLTRDYDFLDMCAPPLATVTSMLRNMITAGEGKELIAADFSAIECRVLNWLAGQEDMVENFRAFDAGDKRRNPYKIMAVRMGRGKTVDDIVKPGEDYQAGKAAVLGCGFQMGGDKFVNAAWDVYQVRVTQEQADEAVRIYRETHPQVKKLWRDSNDAVIEAVSNPGVPVTFGPLGNLKAVKAGHYLYIVLPSGRPLCYATPRLRLGDMPWCELCGKKRGAHVANEQGQIVTADHAFLPARREQVGFSGLDQKTRKWTSQRLYGGLIVENIVQAVSRDLMAEAMLRVEAAGYPTVLSVHDEVVAEVPEDFGDVKEYERLLATTPEWAKGCPVAAEGWRGFRYKK